MIEIEANAGESIDSFAARMVQVANANHNIVRGEFNDIRLWADPSQENAIARLYDELRPSVSAEMLPTRTLSGP